MQLVLTDISEVRFFYIRVVSMALFPFMIVIISFLFWQTYGCVKSMDTKEK